VAELSEIAERFCSDAQRYRLPAVSLRTGRQVSIVTLQVKACGATPPHIISLVAGIDIGSRSPSLTSARIIGATYAV
jgi:hypothetical protein